MTASEKSQKIDDLSTKKVAQIIFCCFGLQLEQINLVEKITHSDNELFEDLPLSRLYSVLSEEAF